nr:ECF RNA polymerase sigma-E factor-like [Nerophis lumbriciformis]
MDRAEESAPSSDLEPAERVRRAVRRIRRGEDSEESFRVIFDVHHRAVAAFFARRISSPEDRLDLTQETFLRVYKGLRGFRGDAPFGAWLFTIARNVLHQRLAKQRQTDRQIAWEEDDTKPAAPQSIVKEDPVEDLVAAENRRKLKHAVQDLPPQRRACIVLRIYHELTYEQIAGVMRLSVGTVKAHLAQARKQLEMLITEGDRI